MPVSTLVERFAPSGRLLQAEGVHLHLRRFLRPLPRATFRVGHLLGARRATLVASCVHVARRMRNCNSTNALDFDGLAFNALLA